MNLQDFFRKNPKVALAFSGGVDSAYLLCAAKSAGADVRPYFVKSQFQPEFELEDAKRLARELNTDMKIIECNILQNAEVAANPADRCYYCKKSIFGMLQEAAEADGYNCIIDGTNASDKADERPGMKALGEMAVISPLRICGLTKEDIRKASKEAGLFTYDKPSYACLATRIPCGEQLTQDKLCRVEKGEAELASLGFRDFRIRLYGDGARIQLRYPDMIRALEMRDEIKKRLNPHFDAVMMDLEER